MTLEQFVANGRAATRAVEGLQKVAKDAKASPTDETTECIRCLYLTIIDISPQWGRISFQDYDRLHRGILLAEKILGGKFVKTNLRRAK